MSCYGPLTAYRPKEFLSDGSPNPDRRLVFKREHSHSGIKLNVPCGRCIGCRLERSRQWAMRCMHEKRCYNMSSFLTLTYSDEYLPYGRTLVIDDLQRFMKRLRKITGNGLRFYACGEYGEHTRRPHYHVLLLNYDFADRTYFAVAKRGERLYTSKVLDQLWSDNGVSLGYAVIGDVTFDSCAYVARYIMKKALGKESVAFERYCPETGVVAAPEFTVMSRRPGIGTEYFKRYGSEVYAHDSVVVNGREVRPPRFYDGKYELLVDCNGSRDCRCMSCLKKVRRRAVDRSDNTSRRLRVKEVCTEKALAMKGRSL